MLSGCIATASGQLKSISSKNGQIQVEVPSSWKTQRDLHDNPDLQVANVWEDNYLIVLSDNKADFDDLTLEEHSDETRQILLESVDNIQISRGPILLEINGQPAVQYEIRGSIDKTKVVYLHTTIEGQDHFHQLIAWTLPSKFSKNRPAMESVINSFQEN